MNKRNNRKEQEIHIDRSAAIVVIITFCIFLACLTVMATFMILDAVEDAEDYPIHTSGPSKPKPDSQTSTLAKPGEKTGIILPGVTKDGTYLSVSASDVKTITGISSECAILVNLNTNTSVAEKEADIIIHPASLTKVMTLLVACENAKDPNVLLTVTQEMLDRRTALDGSGELVDNTTVIDSEGNEMQVSIVGKSVTVEDALHLINYQSDTVACLLIANYVAGSEKAFVELMNAKADELGLVNTNFVNCTGLTEKNTGEGISYNTTTCRELAAIMNCALNNDVAKNIITGINKYSVDIYENGKKEEYVIPFYADWYSREKRLNNNPWAGYIKISGGKTGYEDIPRSCFITYGVHDDTGTEYICVTIGRKINTNGVTAELNNATSTVDTRNIYKNYAKE